MKEKGRQRREREKGLFKFRSLDQDLYRTGRTANKDSKVQYSAKQHCKRQHSIAQCSAALYLYPP
jgi:hypothetical protein